VFEIHRNMQLAFLYPDLEQNSTLNMEAAQKAGLPLGERFSMDHFTYINSVVVTRMFQHLQNTDFLGITV